MTNWIRGNLLVRGTKDNIRRFLHKNLSADGIEIHEDDKNITVYSQQRIYIKGTSCDFLEGGIEFNISTEEPIKECTMDGFSASNYIKPEPYKQMSRKYDIDIKAGGVEIYGGFVQEIEIQKGEIIGERVEEINRDWRDGDDEPIDENMVPSSTSSNNIDHNPFSDLPFDDELPELPF